MKPHVRKIKEKKLRPFSSIEEGMRPSVYRKISNIMGHNQYQKKSDNIMRLTNIKMTYNPPPVRYKKTLCLFVRLKYRNKL